MITLSDLTFAYNRAAPVFAQFSWQVARGEIWAVLGPSGCGKSTLLLLLAGLLRPQRGAIAIGGVPITRPRLQTGLILQEYGLLPWATVRENVLLGYHVRHFHGVRHLHGTPSVDAAAAQMWLERLGLAELAEQYPGQLSGGQRQRVAIARTLILHPDLLLMDEPFSALDSPTRESLEMLTLDLCAAADLTIVLVTHSLEAAAFVGQRLLLLTGAPNHTPRIIEHPHSASAAYRHSEPYRAMCAHLRSQLENQ